MKKFLLIGILILTSISGVFSQVIEQPIRDVLVCIDGNIDITFKLDETAGTFTSGSHFIVELSDKNGVFASTPPVLELTSGLGTNVDYVSGQTKYKNTFIFSATERGSNFKVRVYSSDNIYSPDSGFIQGVENEQVQLSVQDDAPTEFCQGDEIILVSSLSSGTNLWYEVSDPANPIGYKQNQPVSSTGSYYVVNEIGNSCSSTSAIIDVTVTQTPTSSIVDIDGNPEVDQDICAPGSYTLYAETNDPSLESPYFEWLDVTDAVVGNGVSFETSVSGVFRLRTTNYGNISAGGGCPTTSSPIEITVHSFDAEILEKGPKDICAGEEISLNSKETNPDYTYNWYQGTKLLAAPISGVGKINYTFTSKEEDSGDYYLEIITPACNKKSIDPLVITIKDSPVFNIIEGDQSGCKGDIVTLTSSLDDAAYSYQWYKNGSAIGGATSKFIDVTVNSTTPEEYYLGMSFGNCSVVSEKVKVTEVPKPISIIEQGSEAIICEGGDVTLHAVSEGLVDPIYSWIDANGVEKGTGIEFTTSTSGEYRLVTANGGSCSDTSSPINVIISKKANSTIDYVSLADCEQIKITANSDLFGEDASRVVYKWYLDEETVPYYISADATDVDLVVRKSGKYTLETLNYGLCSGTTESVDVIINDLDPNINDDPIVKVCVGSGYTLKAIESDILFTYEWFKNGASVQVGHSSEYLIPSTAGDIGSWIYTLNVFDPASNCGKDSDPVTVQIKNVPEAIITNGNIVDACGSGNDTVILQSEETNPSYTYKWFKEGVEITDTDGIDSQLTVSVDDNTDTDTKYKLEVSFGDSCSETSSETTIHKVLMPQAFVNPSEETVVCDDGNGASVLLESASTDKEAPTTYRWFKVVNGVDEVIPGANQWQYSAQATGEYKLEVRNKGVCTNLSAPTRVIITPSVEAVISPNTDQYVCDNVPFSSVNSVNVIVGVTTFQWYRIVDGVEKAIPFATEETYNAKEEGDYFFEAYNHGVCGSRSEVVNVRFTQFEHDIEEAPLVRECEGHQIILHSINTDEINYQFTWFKEGSTDIVGKGLTLVIDGDIANSGNYTLEVSEKGATCVKTSEPVQVVILPDPISKINLGGGFNCEGEIVTLNSDETNQFYDYTWYFNDNEIVEGGNYSGVNSPSLSVVMYAETEGVYNLKVSIGSCNSGKSNAVMLSMEDLDPQLDVDPGMVLCKDGSIALTVLTNNNDDVAKYQWYRDGNVVSGEFIETMIVTQIGRYKAEVTSKNSGCIQYTDEIIVSMAPLMGVLEDTLRVNVGEIAKFEAYGGDSYTWYKESEDGSDGPGEIVQEGGSVFETVSGGNAEYYVRIENSSYCDELIKLLVISGNITVDDIQNIMTPNGDGHNDTWELPPGFVKSGDEVILLNRQGAVVYKTKNYTNDWSGTFNDGPALPAATYYYVIKRVGKEPVMGSISIMR